MPSLIRHPFKLERVYHPKFIEARLILGVDLKIDFGMTPEMIGFLQKHARCCHCEKVLRRIESHLDCGIKISRKKKKSSKPALFIPYQFEQAFYDLDDAEVWKSRAYARRFRARNAGGHSNEQLRTILKLQAERCFYCFASLLGDDGTVNGFNNPTTCHKDHFLSLVSGGTNDISNIVLSCPSCNHEKCALDGGTFVLMKFHKVSPSRKKDLLRLYKNRQSHPFKLHCFPEEAEFA